MFAHPQFWLAGYDPPGWLQLPLIRPCRLVSPNAQSNQLRGRGAGPRAWRKLLMQAPEYPLLFPSTALAPCESNHTLPLLAFQYRRSGYLDGNSAKIPKLLPLRPQLALQPHTVRALLQTVRVHLAHHLQAIPANPQETS